MPKTEWIRIAATLNEIPFNPNGVAEVNADGKTICIGRTGEAVYAFAQKCPHAGGYLVDGHTDAAGNIVCPIHRYKFCMKNGRNVSGEGYYLKHWSVDIREDGVYVEMEKGLLKSLF